VSNILKLSSAAVILLAANATDLNLPAAAAYRLSGSSAGKDSSTGLTKFEALPAKTDEAAQIGQIIDLTTRLMERRYGDSLARRGVHPKDHGCVKASFTVKSDLPEAYRVGVFAEPGKKYDAWIRFSNAAQLVSADFGKGGASSRGMAIKLMGVNGATLLDEPGAKTQDFLLINQPMFAFADVSTYLKVTQLQLRLNDDSDKIFKTLFGVLPDPGFPPIAPMTPEEIRKTQAIAQTIGSSKLGNPLDAQYFSAAPFLFGKDRVAKFSAAPRGSPNTPFPATLSDNFLREALKKSLDVTNKDAKPAEFVFQVQIRPDGLKFDDPAFPIEDASAEWKADGAAKFQDVAVIAIPPQDFDNPLRITECEHLAFTPWHGLDEHQPLGGINRLRLGVYTASSKRRAQTQEPSTFPTEYPR
jgi:hypothetical protein